MAKTWIKGAIEHPGAFSAKAKAAGKTTQAFAEEHKGSKGKLGKEARLALTLMGMHHKKPKAEAPAPRKSRADVRYTNTSED